MGPDPIYLHHLFAKGRNAMNPTIASLLPTVIVMIATLASVGLVYLWKRHREKTKRSPLVKQLLRSPGETLRKQIDDVHFDIATLVTAIPLLLVLLFASHISASYLGGRSETAARFLVSFIFAVCVLGYGLYKITSLIRRRANLRLGYEGELAVSQELNQLMRDGALVFHDVPGDGFNIDHVVASPKGIYAIETKARTKPNRDMGKEDAKVVFDGKTLAFPTWQESEPLDQAARQARWLSNWLSKAIGERVEAKGAIALPGWFVDCTGRADVVVFNPRNIKFLLNGWLKEPLQESVIQRIAYQLDQRCRDVEPTLYHAKN